MNIFWICFGGVLGVNLRYFIISLLHNKPVYIFSATLIANTLGSFLAGLFLPFCVNYSNVIKYFVMIGFLGSLTTFSSISVESLQFIKETRYFYAFMHIFLNNFLGVLFCFCGYFLSSKLL